MFFSAMNAQFIIDHDFALQASPSTKLWQIFGANQILLQIFSNYLKMAQLTKVLVLSLVDNKKTFFTVCTLKSKVRNKLMDDLALFVQMEI